jgi:hypothetical protein
LSQLQTPDQVQPFLHNFVFLSLSHSHRRILAEAINVVLWDKELPCILTLSQLGLAETTGMANG